jgi:hypothetical protein
MVNDISRPKTGIRNSTSVTGKRTTIEALIALRRSFGFTRFLSLDDCVEVLAGQEEHILCLNQVLNRHGVSLPFAILSESEFKQRVGSIPKQIGLSGHSFTPLSNCFLYGPTLDQFFVAIMKKPASK